MMDVVFFTSSVRSCHCKPKIFFPFGVVRILCYNYNMLLSLIFSPFVHLAFYSITLFYYSFFNCNTYFWSYSFKWSRDFLVMVHNFEALIQRDTITMNVVLVSLLKSLSWCICLWVNCHEDIHFGCGILQMSSCKSSSNCHLVFN